MNADDATRLRLLAAIASEASKSQGGAVDASVKPLELPKAAVEAPTNGQNGGGHHGSNSF